MMTTVWTSQQLSVQQQKADKIPGGPLVELAIPEANGMLAPQAPRAPVADASGVEGDAGRFGIVDRRYVLEQHLGGGGMGVVYRARDTLMERHRDRDPFVALKLIHESMRNDQQARSLLQRECSRAQRLSHPNIVRVFYFGCDQATDTDYLTMELLRGNSLDHVIRERAAALEWSQAAPMVDELLAGLEYAHAEGVVHSDIKPSNLFVTDAGHLKILDFGIAVPLRNSESTGTDTYLNPRRLGAVAPRHSSLEMFQGKDADVSDDVYSVTCVIYELITGTHPYGGFQTPQAAERNLVPAVVPSLSRAQNDALREGLQFRRAQRTATIAELRRGLFPVIRPVAATKRSTSQYLWLAGTAVTAALVARFTFNLHAPVQPANAAVSNAAVIPAALIPSPGIEVASAPAAASEATAGPVTPAPANAREETTAPTPSVTLAVAAERPSVDSPSRPVKKATVVPKKSEGSSCEAIEQRAQLGEPLHEVDRVYLKNNC
jgi:serine/threonine protein kinase